MNRITMRTIRRVSSITGKVNCMELLISDAQWIEWTSKNPRMVQDVFPNLSNEEREFLLSGITPQEWNKYIAGSEE